MRKISFLFSLLVLGAAACKKTGEMPLVDETATFSASLKASTDSVTLSTSNNSDTVLTLTWPAVNYGQSVPVTYTLEMDVPSDTAGPSGWSKAQQFVAGNNVLSYSFAGQALNNDLQTMNLFTTSGMVFRVISSVDQYNGAASTVPSTYTSTVSVGITPYLTNLWIPGAYQGWDPATAPIVNSFPGHAGLFEGYVNIIGTGTQDFKFTNAPDWNHVNYGDGGNGTLTTNGLAGDLTVPNGGYYELSANLNTNTWTATATTWSIIGDATPGGWSNDTQLTYDAVNQVWTTTVAMLAAGSYKFRANDAWSIDFGIDNSGNLTYADNPLLPYNGTLNNLTVPADGTYKITLDLHVSQHYTYSAVKQ